MEILKILHENGKTLTNEELNCLEEELEIGDYPSMYFSNCKSLIASIRAERIRESKKEKTDPVLVTLLRTKEEVGEGATIQTDSASPLDIFLRKLVLSRSFKGGGIVIKNAINDKIITLEEVLADKKNYTIEEKNDLLNYFEFDSDLLNKYYSLFDKKLLCATQIITEEFYMNHYQDFGIYELRKNEKSPWINDKNQRSNKLQIFLKLKGINL